MKILKCALTCLTICALHPAYAEVVSGEMSKDNQKVVAHLNPGDILLIQYDLSRGRINREHEWTTYAVFCSTRGKAEVDLVKNSVHEMKKLPALMSQWEYKQENIGTDIDSKGELKITNLSEFYSGTIVTCEFVHKFGE